MGIGKDDFAILAWTGREYVGPGGAAAFPGAGASLVAHFSFLRSGMASNCYRDWRFRQPTGAFGALTCGMKVGAAVLNWTSQGRLLYPELTPCIITHSNKQPGPGMGARGAAGPVAALCLRKNRLCLPLGTATAVGVARERGHLRLCCGVARGVQGQGVPRGFYV